MRRSKLSKGVKQELYAMFTAHNFVRTIVVETAETHDIQPLQISSTGVTADLRPRLSNEEPKESWSRERKPTVAGQVRPWAWIYTPNRRALGLGGCRKTPFRYAIPTPCCGDCTNWPQQVECIGLMGRFSDRLLDRPRDGNTFRALRGTAQRRVTWDRLSCRRRSARFLTR